MTKSREQLAAEGFLIVHSRMAARRKDERRDREKRRQEEKDNKTRTPPAPASGDTSSSLFGTPVADPAAFAAQVIRAGQKARGELAEETPQPTGFAAAVLAAADLARAGGPALPEPTGLAAQIIAAGEKRRKPMGDS
jgi:hypothetical protein